MVHDWFSSHMSDPRHYVFGNGCKSTLRRMSTGVVQGSILTPLFFIIYIIDLVIYFRVLKFSLHANDMCLSLASNHFLYLMEVFNSEVAHVVSWFKANFPILNPSRSNYSIFHRDRKLVPSLPPGLILGGQEFVGVTVVRFLGFLLYECLTFSNHVNSVAFKVPRYTSIVYKRRRYFSLDSLKLSYYDLQQHNLLH